MNTFRFRSSSWEEILRVNRELQLRKNTKILRLAHELGLLKPTQRPANRRANNKLRRFQQLIAGVNIDKSP